MSDPQLFPSNRLFVFQQQDEDCLLLMLKFEPEKHLEKNSDAPRNTDPSVIQFTRQSSEPFRVLLGRMQAKLGSRLDKTYGKRVGKEIKQLRRKLPHVSDFALSKQAQDTVKPTVFPDVCLLNRGKTIDVEEPINRTLTDKETVMKVGGEEYCVILDAPRVDKLLVELDPIVGCTCLPRINLASGSEDEINFHWFALHKEKAGKRPKMETDLASGIYNLQDASLVHTGRSFQIPPELSGHRLRVLADFGPNSLATLSEPSEPIAHKPGAFMWEKRQEQTGNRLTGNKYRIMSYNVLANNYLDLKVDGLELWFPFCPKRYQKIFYRYPLILSEIPGYNSDLICLQEVEKRLYNGYLNYLLAQHNYESCFKAKVQEADAEGATTAWNRDRFSLISTHDIPVSDLIKLESNLDLKNYCFNSKISIGVKKDGQRVPQTVPTIEYFLTRPTIIQVVALKVTEQPDTILLVANTHLHSKPYHEHLRVIQTILCARYLYTVVHDYKRKHPSHKVVLSFCGDFNFTPDTGPYRFLSENSLDSSDPTWRHCANETGLSVENPLRLHNATGTPNYTNYCVFSLNEGKIEKYTGQNPQNRRGFGGCLDYIWLSEQLKVDTVIPLPEHQLVTENIALPSKITPSDHLPVICEVSFC